MKNRLLISVFFSFALVFNCLLYAKTDEDIVPNNTYQMSGNQISVKTLDLNKDFTEIAAQLNSIVTEHFGSEGVMC